MRPSFAWIPIAAVLVPLSFADGGLEHQKKQAAPVKMGTSGGSAKDASKFYCCGGTLGALVLRDNVLHILSNNHILARSGSAAAGEDTIQPGLIDSQCSAGSVNIVGDFAGNLVPLGSANVDAALAVARPNMVDTSGSILDIGVPYTTPQDPVINLPVRKSGRTTGFTTGKITSVNTSVKVQYQKGCNQGKKFTVLFTNQIVTGAMSAGGDSGSLLLSNDDTSPNPVGLLFAGSSSVTVHNPIQDVVAAFTNGGHSFSFVGNAGFSVGPESSVRTPASEDLEAALQAKVENEATLFQHSGVLGVGIGAAEDDPTAAVIVIYFESPSGEVPSTLPTVIDGIPVRVILTDTIVAQ